MYNSGSSHQTQQNLSRLQYVLALRSAGLSVIPIDNDGSKRPPATFRWRNYSARRPSEDELRSWFEDFDQDIAIIGGEVSGNLAILDFDEKVEAGNFDKWRSAVDADLLAKIIWVRTPSGGYHGYCKTPAPVRTRKLAIDEEGRTLIELKAEGGYCLAPGIQSYGHYERLNGPDFDNLSPLTAAEWEAIVSAAEGLTRGKRPTADRPTSGASDLDHEEAIAAIPMPVDDRRQRAAEWLKYQPGAQQGRGADGYCYALAIKLLKGFALPEDDANELLYDWGQRHDQTDNAGHHYPWSFGEISHKVADAVCVDYENIGDQLNLTTYLEEQVESIIRPPTLLDRSEIPSQPIKGAEPSEAIQAATKEKTTPKKIIFRKWSALQAIADKQTEDWLIPNWIEFGSLTMLTGLPFSGKSCTVADIIGSMATGRLWCDMKLPSVPIILLDLENKERILVRRIRAALEGDQGCLEDLLFAVDVPSLDIVNNPLDAQRISEIITALGEALGGLEKCFVVIDTMRSAFGGRNEIDPQEMSALLYPLQQCAKQHNAAVLLLHHNSRGKDEYAGSAAIAGAADYLWNWHSNYKTGEGELELVGTRGDRQDSLHFRFDDQRKKNVFVGRDGDVCRVKRSSEDYQRLAPVLKLFSTDPEPRPEAKRKIMSQLDMPEATARKYLKQAVAMGWLIETPTTMALSTLGLTVIKQGPTS